MASKPAPLSNYQRIYAVIRNIPRGKVATYGQIAILAGIPRHARQVGYALNKLPDELEIPWQRVVNASGEISKRTWTDHDKLQRVLLEDEGVSFDASGRISLSQFRWQP